MTQNKKPFRLIETVTNTAFSRPALIVAISTLVLLISIFSVRSLKVELDLYNSHNTDFPSLTRLWDMMEEFKDFSSISILVEWPEVPSSEKVCSLVTDIKNLENSVEGTKLALHLFKLRRIVNEPDHYWFPESMPDPCQTHNGTLATLKKDLDPKHPFSKLSATDKQMMIQVKLESDFTLKAVGQWIQDLKSADYTVSVVGPAVFQYYINEILKKDSFLHLITIIFFLLFFKFFFGTWRSGLYYLYTVIATLVCLAGFMALFKFPLDILTNSLFLITAIAGTADYIFILWGMSRGLTLKDSVVCYCRPGFFTTLTTTIGFLSLCVSDLQTIQRFGLAAGMGALLEWFFTFMALPAFLKVCKFETEFVTKKQDQKLIQRVVSLNRWTPSKALTIVFCIFVFAGPYLFFKLKFEENPAKKFLCFPSC